MHIAREEACGPPAARSANGKRCFRGAPPAEPRLPQGEDVGGRSLGRVFRVSRPPRMRLTIRVLRGRITRPSRVQHLAPIADPRPPARNSEPFSGAVPLFVAACSNIAPLTPRTSTLPSGASFQLWKPYGPGRHHLSSVLRLRARGSRNIANAAALSNLQHHQDVGGASLVARVGRPVPPARTSRDPRVSRTRHRPPSLLLGQAELS